MHSDTAIQAVMMESSGMYHTTTKSPGNYTQRKYELNHWHVLVTGGMMP